MTATPSASPLRSSSSVTRDFTRFDSGDSNRRMINRGQIMRSSFSRRDGAIETISRAVALVCRNPQNALQQARADRPDDYELHESIQTRAAVVPTSAATVTSFSQTSVADIAAVV